MLSVSCGPGFGLPPNGLPLVSGGNCGFVLDPLTFEEAWNASSVFCTSMQRRLCQVEQSQDEEFEERGKRQEITPGGGRRPRSLTVHGGPLDRYPCDCVTYVTHCAVTSRAAARVSSTLGMNYSTLSRIYKRVTYIKIPNNAQTPCCPIPMKTAPNPEQKYHHDESLSTNSVCDRRAFSLQFKIRRQ